MKRYIKQLSIGLLALCLGGLFNQCEKDQLMTNIRDTSQGSETPQGGETQSTWLLYDDGNVETAWGGSTTYYEWAVLFPSSMLYQYSDIQISQVKYFFYETGAYTIKIYSGNNTTPTNLLFSQTISISEQGWKTFSISPVPISNSQCLWVALGKSCQDGQYPMCTAAGSNNPYARFIKGSDNNWYDFFNINNADATWMIRACITYTNAKSGKVEEMELSLPQSLQIQANNKYCPNVAVRKAM